MPLLAFLMVVLFNLHPAVKIALLLWRCRQCRRSFQASRSRQVGTPPYVAGLLVTMAVLSIVIVPLGHMADRPTAASSSDCSRRQGHDGGLRRHRDSASDRSHGPTIRTFARKADSPPSVPIRHRAPGRGFRARPFHTVARHVGLGRQRNADRARYLHHCGRGLGHTLGGPIADNRTALALATGTRHPGVAMAIASATFPEEKAVVAVVILHLLVSAIVCLPYVKWRSRVHNMATGGTI